MIESRTLMVISTRLSQPCIVNRIMGIPGKDLDGSFPHRKIRQQGVPKASQVACKPIRISACISSPIPDLSY